MRLPPRDELRDYLLSFDTFSQVGRPEEAFEYIGPHLDRLIRTVQLFSQVEKQGRVLELGSSPYVMTLMLSKYLGCDLTLANFPGDYGEPAGGEGLSRVTSVRYGESYDFPFKMFNVERDSFPYADGVFDSVLCCEIIEHLIMDPSHMLHEIHRVLRPDGYLLITTPNVLAIENMVELVRGTSPYRPYSGYGVYGRHNREYTPGELDQLLRLHGFVPEKVVVEDWYPHTLWHRLLTKIGPLRWRRDSIMMLAQVTGPLAQCYPDWLYRAQQSRRRVTRNTFVVGDGEVFQLGRGWHGFENWPPGIRWTGREAVVFLKPAGHETTLGVRAYTDVVAAHGEIWVGGHVAGALAIEPKQWREIVVPLPGAVRAEIAAGVELEVRLCLDSLFVPSQVIPGSTDGRELGIAVERIWLA